MQLINLFILTISLVEGGIIKHHNLTEINGLNATVPVNGTYTFPPNATNSSFPDANKKVTRSEEFQLPVLNGTFSSSNHTFHHFNGTNSSLPSPSNLSSSNPNNGSAALYKN